jgi:hypothetical protein
VDNEKERDGGIIYFGAKMRETSEVATGIGECTVSKSEQEVLT